MLLASLLVLAACSLSQPAGSIDLIPVGRGGYGGQLPRGVPVPPSTIYATAGAAKGPMPTNDWWSSLAWLPYSERHYGHPLAYQAERAGLRVFYASRMTSTKDAIFGFMPAGNGRDLVLGHSQCDTFPAADVDGFSDWFVSVKFASGDARMSLTYGHGSPFVYARHQGGLPRLRFSSPPRIWQGDSESPVLGVSVGEHHYGLFGPSGAGWSGLDGDTLTCRTGKDYFSLAVLPDDRPETLSLFREHAYAHVTNTQVAWRFDEQTSQVTTTFSIETVAHEGDTRQTLIAQYPHQWKHSTAAPLPHRYRSVRGDLKLVKTAGFQTVHRFPGVLPVLPNVGGCRPEEMALLLQQEARRAVPADKDTYWDGKWLGRTATLVSIAEQYGQAEAAAQLRGKLRRRLEQWLSATDAKGRPDSAGLFCYDERWGALIGYPSSYGSARELNDHHFHYGYFLRAAAEAAHADPEWASPQQWGGMVELLIRDIASDDRRDQRFPFLRCFDPYAGHSWASGHAKFGDGNNNESSSEAMNAWCGLILWGQYTGNHRLRDLGIYLYTTEMNAIQEYWFDVHDTNHPADYQPSVVTMIWGGKGANGTWFSANPEVVHGINWLPFHGGSLYLGHDPRYVEKNYRALREENGEQPWDDWADLIWMYRALSDPEDGLRQFNAGKDSLPQESGNSKPNAYHWIGSLQRLGQVQPGITANHPLYAVFDKGGTRTYVVHRGGEQKKTIRFSDGFQLVAESAGFTTAQAQAGLIAAARNVIPLAVIVRVRVMRTADVIVVGAGGSGLAAAARCVELDLSVVVLEKQPQVGGTTGIAVGSFTANGTRHQQRAGIHDTPGDHAEDAGKFAKPEIESRNNEPLRRFFLSHTAATLDWLTGLGLAFHGPSPEPPNRVPRMHNVVPNAKAYVAALKAKVLRGGGRIVCNAAVDELLRDGDRISGVAATVDRQRMTFSAQRGVVLAAGDYANSSEMIERFKGEKYSAVEGINPHATGDGHRLAEQAGARMMNMDVTYGPELRFVAPPASRTGFARLLPTAGFAARLAGSLLPLVPKPIVNAFIKRLLVTWQHPEDKLFDDGAILINRQGVRFCDERLWPERELSVARQPKKLAFIVLDRRLIERFSEWPNFISTAPEIAYAYVADYLKLRSDVAVEATSLDVLAGLRGLPVDAVRASIDSVNQHRAASGLPQLRGERWVLLGPLKAYFTTTEGGAAINQQFEVLDETGRPAPGLYAVGQNGLGGQILWGHGLHIAWAITSGRLVGEHLATLK